MGLGEVSREDLAYLAGLIDGEGCLGVYEKVLRGNAEFNVVCNVVNTNLAVIEWIAETFGGAVYARPRKHEGWKTVYVWQITDRRLLNRLLKEVSPFLKIKREQAEIVSALPYNVRTRYLPREEQDKIRRLRRDSAARCAALNKRGPQIKPNFSPPISIVEGK